MWGVAVTLCSGRAFLPRIPTADCVDVVLAGQSWHWMDLEFAAPEVARVLRGRGALALVWNELDIDVPWVAELDRLTSDGDLLRIAEEERVSLPAPFDQYEERSFDWVQSLVGPIELAELAGTWSWVALHPRRQAILDAVERLGASVQEFDGQVRVPHQCHCIRYTVGQELTGAR